MPAGSADAASLTTLTLAIEGGVARVGLNRPEVRHAINLTMVEELTALLRRLGSDPEVLALVLTGEGGTCFASGADIAELRERSSREALLALNAGLFQAVEDFPKPTIAAIRGFALGGGLELAMACDLRITSRNAKLGLPEVTLGIYPAAGGTWRLPRLVGFGHAKELVFTGRLIEGDEAYALGLVEQVCLDEEVEPRAIELAKRIARNAPLAVRMAKLSFQAAMRGGDPTVAERLGQALLFDSADKQQRMTAFLEKRAQKGSR